MLLKIQQNLNSDDMGVKIPYGYVSKFMEKEWEKAIIMVNKIIYEAGEPEQVIRSKSIFFQELNLIFVSQL